MEEHDEDRIGRLAAKIVGPEEREITAQDQAANYRSMGITLVIIGLLMAGYALFGFEATAPYSDTLNIGLLNEQLMLTIIGCAFFLAGTISCCIGGIIRRL